MAGRGVPDDLVQRSPENTRSKRSSGLCGKRFRLPEAEPEDEHESKGNEDKKYCVPVSHGEDQGANHGRQSRNNHEKDKGKRHDTRHFRANETVADNGKTNDARTGCAHALKKAGDQHAFERVRLPRKQGTKRKNEQATKDNRTPTSCVRQRARNKRRDTHPDQKRHENEGGELWV